MIVGFVVWRYFHEHIVEARFVSKSESEIVLLHCQVRKCICDVLNKRDRFMTASFSSVWISAVSEFV